MILVDVAVGSNTLVDLAPLAAIGAQLHKLESADVAFTGNGPVGPVTIAAEIKRIDDLIASLQNGRANGIDGQFRKMCTAYDVRWLCYYGLTRPNPNTGALQVGTTWAQKGHPTRLTLDWQDWGGDGSDGTGAPAKGKARRRSLPYDYLEKFFVSPAFTELGLLVKHAVDVDEVGAWLRILHDSWQKPYSDHRCMHAFDASREVKPPTIKPPTRATLQRAKTAASLPSIGYERAWPVAEHFRSLRHMFTASASEWAEIATTTEAGKRRRLGPVVAAAVTRVIGDVEK